jgi:hypothetical protein
MPGIRGIVSNRHFSRDGLFIGSRTERVFVRDFKPEPNGFADILQRFIAVAPLTPATGKRRTTGGKTFFGLDEQDFVFHGESLNHEGPRLNVEP